MSGAGVAGEPLRIGSPSAHVGPRPPCPGNMPPRLSPALCADAAFREIAVDAADVAGPITKYRSPGMRRPASIPTSLGARTKLL